ncbi:MAG: Ku protein [Chloroflexota bacterium]
MARAFWAGAISLGMVSIPVRLFPATRRRDVRFHELDRVTGRRVRHLRVREEPAEEPSVKRAPGPATAVRYDSEPLPPRELAAADVVKGFEVSPGRFVSMRREELEEMQPERSRTIDVELFVESEAVDPIYYDVAYHAVPLLDHARPFAVLLDAMRDEKRVAISWVTLRTRRHLAALRPFSEGLLLSTMFYADEILPAPWAGLAGAALTPRERDMARLLVRTLSGPFEPERYRDEYRERVLAMIEERTGDAIEVLEPVAAATPSNVGDLLAALKASIDQAKEPKRRRRGA